MNYGPINKKMKSMIHGGDYNPEQWIDYDGIWDEDFRLMDLAKCNTMTVGVFSWSMLEPEEGKFEFGWLDEIMDKLADSGKFAVLATPSGARPPWLAQKYPEVLRVDQDRSKRLYGGRHNHCFTSPVYREKTRIINEKLAERYKNHSALLVWHVSNEFSGDCHCELCQNAFRDWLKERYDNDLDKLNNAWWTTFWSHKYTNWSQIESPSTLGEYETHGQILDWKRFVTYQTIDFMLNEMKPLRKVTPDIPITNNFMRMFMWLDYWKMAKHLDVVSWDSYPFWHKGKSEIDEAVSIAFMHDIMRCMKAGKPFMVMESVPSAVNWQDVCKLKRPKMHMLSSIQAIAHGSDTMQYFQWRKSRGSFEKFHGAVVDHVGHEKTRVFQDVAELGNVLEKLDEVVGTSVQPEVAIIYDWENFWAIEDEKGMNNSAKKYDETTICHYRPFWEMGIPVDVIDSNQPLDKYKIIIAPMLYMVREETAKRIEKFVENGGVFVSTYFSGMVNENDLCYLGGFPGPLRKVLGIWSEETDALYPEDRNHVNVIWNEFDEKTYEAIEICDLIHLESAEAMGWYMEDFYSGRPALTINKFGKGSAYYTAFRNSKEFEKDFYRHLANKENINPILSSVIPDGISIQTRYDDENKFVFVMNFSKEQKHIKLENAKYINVITGNRVKKDLKLNGYDIAILKVIS